MNRADLISVALGEQPADMVVKGGNLVNVHTAEIYQADIAVKGDRIAGVGEVSQTMGKSTLVLDAAGKYVTPGLIDGHHHVGSCYLNVHQLAASLTARGTTALATDLYEIFVVWGPEGVKFALSEAKKTPLKLLYSIPVHLIGWEKLGTYGVDLNPDEMKAMLKWPETVGINEPPPSTAIGKHPALLDLIREALALGKVFVGHAAETSGKELNAYVSLGAYSDHESLTAKEALDKARLGVRIIAREDSASPNLADVIRAVTEYGADPRYFSFCTDDMDPLDLYESGHMDFKLKKAIAQGVDPVTAIQMATINAAEAYKVDSELGSLVPGKIADIVLVDGLVNFRPSIVVANGRIVAREGKPVEKPKSPTYPNFMLRGFRLKKTLEPQDFEVKTQIKKDTVTARVIGAMDGTIVKNADTAKLKVKDGVVLSDVQNDILKLSVVERYKATGRIGNGFISGFGLKAGALASTFNTVHFNIAVLSTNDRDACAAANKLAEIGGGSVAVKDGKVLALLELPVGGIISNEPLETIATKIKKIHEAAWDMGCKMRAP